MRNLLTSIFYFLSVILSSVYSQQYKYDAGGGIGISSAYGDINQNRLMYHPGVSFGATFRSNHDMRWAFVYELGSVGLGGDSRDFDNKFPYEKHIDFKSRLWQLSWGAEFNFFNYGWGFDYRSTSRFSPFITAGVALGVVTGNEKSAFSMSIPFGGGVKYKFAPRWNMTGRFIFAKMLTDKADGIEDPYEIKSDALKNTDWYSVLSIGVTYDFGSKKMKCNNL